MVSEEEMKDYDDDVKEISVSTSAFRRTRSQAAPDWSVTESLILVNEVAAVEADCSVALSSHQQWNIIAQNCAALDVPRNLAQCRRKWRALLAEHDRLRGTAAAGGKLPPNFDCDLFEAVERVVRAREERGMVDPESDSEAGNEARDATVEIGSKRKGQRSKLRHRVQKPKVCLEQRPEDSHEEEPEDDHSEDEYLKDFLESRPKLKCAAERPPKDLVMPPKSLPKAELHENNHIERPKPITVEKIAVSREVNQETLTLKLQDLAVEIEAIAAESAPDYKGGVSQNAEDSHTDFTRRQGDKLITSLGDFSNTLKQLCDILQECK
ncbi:unnamed protein product [Sphenostylis stenocarpa]|uniref:Myb-like domain-containing protein n=1 Tax=Sphenostylis stenocarpa TaxID=92480 RepID=A0AA86VUT3_9FABA|nr:unnamed protein product [Sphenostylis stenocarpa]